MELTTKHWIFIGLGLISLSFLFHILTHALPQWGVYAPYSSGPKETIGLWNDCSTGGGQSFCVSLSCDFLSASKCSLLIFTRSFWTVTTVFCALTVIVFILKLIPNLIKSQKLSNGLLNIPSGCVLTGIIGIILGFIFFLQDTQFSVGACPFLAILAYILQVVVAIIARRIKKDGYIST